jgi:hypothetical protein
MGKEQPQEGTVRMGEYNIVPNYFEQNQAEALDPNLTVLNTLIQVWCVCVVCVCVCVLYSFSQGQRCPHTLFFI